MLKIARYKIWIIVLFLLRNYTLAAWRKKCPKVSQNGAITPLSPPPYGGSCFSMLRQSVFVVWLVILFLLVHDEVNIQRW